MTVVLGLLIACGLVLGVVVAARYWDSRVWRRSLVSYRLRLPTTVETADVVAWLSSQAALTHAPRGALLPEPPLVVELVALSTGLEHRIRVPKRMDGSLLASLRAALPGARLETRLADTVEQLKQGHSNARRILDYLDRPHELYQQANTGNRTKLNRLLFLRLKIDVGSNFDVQVTGDELTEPFATIVYLRREQYPVPLLSDQSCEPQASDGSNEKGDTPARDVAFRSRVLALLQPALAMNAHESSSNSTLAGQSGERREGDLRTTANPPLDRGC